MTDSPKFDIAERREKLWTIAPMFTEGTPHGAALGLKFVAVDIGRATISLPYNAKLIGDSETRVMFGGAVTALLDQACGLAALAALEKLDALATLDLRIDYMRAATPGETIIAEAHCYKATRDVAFVRAIAHDGDSEDPVASAQAIFMQIKSGSEDHMADRKKAAENIADARGGTARA